MIKGIGIDAVAISRFAEWHAKSLHELKKIFTDQEIEYCLSNPQKSAERFAVRFAAKEAFLKALQSQSNQKLSFFTVAKKVEIIRSHTGAPRLIFCDDSSLLCHLSLTHTDDIAIAYIIIS